MGHADENDGTIVRRRLVDGRMPRVFFCVVLFLGIGKTVLPCISNRLGRRQ